jgi:putative component of toxin-antitoxin plasmid stabilization module
MICFPLDNTPYEAKDMGTYLATRTRGVFSSDGNLAVTPSESGLSVSVSPGLAWLKWSDYWGTAALQEQALTLDLDTADGALKRIDAIVCRLDKVNNRAEIVVKKGAPSSAPIVVPPVRDANYDELYIATVLIGAGVISISASAITDQRLNEEYCGLMRDGVTGIPTASLHAQAQQILTELTDALNAQIVRQSAEFDAWFDDLKGKLGEDPATALQQQVDNLNAAVVGDAFQASGTPVSIAYAGTNRIASITAYGENAQGGTTEAPVAITGVDSVFVGGRNLLPKATKTQTIYGVTFTPNPNGSVSVSGTCAGGIATYNYADNLIPISPNQVVYLSGASQLVKVVINEKTPSGAFVRNVLVDRGQGISGTLTKQKEENILYATLQVQIGDAPNLTIHPMLNLGESPLPYEPYQGSVTQLPIPRPLRRVGDVKDKCVTRQDYESAEKLVVTYNVGFVELDGTEDVVFDTYGNTQKRIRFDLDRNAIARYALKFSHGNPGDTPTVTGGISASFNRDVLNRLQIICSPDTWTALGVTDTATAKTWLAAQKAAGTPIQVAYQLATPETYATDPVDFDNAAGPLIIMTGGELEVRMTELVGSRSPEIVAKMDKATYDADGDGVVDRAADSVKLAGLTPIIDNPSSTNNRNTWYFPFTGTNNKDGTRKYYAALYADEATRAANKVGGGALVDTNDGRLSNARRASNITMGYDGNLWISYS